MSSISQIIPKVMSVQVTYIEYLCRKCPCTWKPIYITLPWARITGPGKGFDSILVALASAFVVEVATPAPALAPRSGLEAYVHTSNGLHDLELVACLLATRICLNEGVNPVLEISAFIHGGGWWYFLNGN